MDKIKASKDGIVNRSNIRYMICLCIIMIFNFFVSFIKAEASTTITISGWYSNAIVVGYWESEPRVFFRNLSSSFNISPYISTAVTKWNQAGIDNIITTSPTYANIEYYGGTRGQLNGMGFNYLSNTEGDTSFEYTTTEIIARNGVSTFYLVEHTSACASTCSEANDYQLTTTHELGHALGWWGHATNPGNVMCASYEEAGTSLTNEDITQLKQIYDAMK